MRTHWNHTWQKTCNTCECIFPTKRAVPKKRNPRSLNDYRPIALTSIAMKCFERIVHCTLLKYTTQHLDPSQFAYKQNRSTDDATLTPAPRLHTSWKTCLLCAFFLSTSPQLSIQYNHIWMAAKLLAINVCDRLVLWIVDFLVQRSTRSVRYQTAVSSSRSISAGSSWYCFVSSFVHPLYESWMTAKAMILVVLLYLLNILMTPQ